MKRTTEVRWVSIPLENRDRLPLRLRVFGWRYSHRSAWYPESVQVYRRRVRLEPLEFVGVVALAFGLLGIVLEACR